VALCFAEATTYMESRDTDTRKPFILLLNGTSSVGKTSVAKALITIIPKEKEVILLSIDTFVDMVPDHLVGESEVSLSGFRFIKENGATKVEPGPLGNLLIEQMYNIAKNASLAGFSSIIDDVLLSEDTIKTTNFGEDTNLVKVLLHCDLKELRDREEKRGDRKQGLAEGLLYTNRIAEDYDLRIDTTSILPEVTAAKILEYLNKKSLV